MCLSVRGAQVCLNLNLHLSLIGLSQVCIRSVSGLSQIPVSSLTYIIVQTEPKILRLV